MNLFQLGDFELHSGNKSRYKIDCDALTYNDFEMLAAVIDCRWKFTEVVGIPIGGIAFAAKLQKYVSPVQGRDIILIVDDVLTSGNSMREMRRSILNDRPDAQILQAVIFDRSGWWHRDSTDRFALFSCNLPEVNRW